MIRLITILVLVLSVKLSYCGQKQVVSKAGILGSTSSQIDTSTIAVLPFDTAQNWLFIGSKPVELTNADLTQIEILLKECIDNYNPEQERQFKEINEKHPNFKLDKKNFIIELSGYKRQYIAAINSKGEKEIWVNCFCNTRNTDWKKEIREVMDGGNCYLI